MYGYVYLILNKVTGKTYVGQHKSSNTWSKDTYMGSGKLLKRAQAKYGIENFEKFFIQCCETREELNNQEEFWIAEYRKRGKAEYNIANGGQGGQLVDNPQAWNKGLKMTDEWKKEHPNGAIGHKWSTNKGQKKTPEQIENNRKAQKEYASRADYVNPASGRHWYTNGTVNVFTYECPIGYKPGMVRR